MNDSDSTDKDILEQIILANITVILQTGRERSKAQDRLNQGIINKSG